MLDRLRARATRKNAVPLVGGAAYVVVNVVNNLADGWDNVQRLPWERTGEVLQHPAAAPAAIVVGILWVVVFGDVRQPDASAEHPPDFVIVKGVRWRRRNRDGVNQVDPYPYCPNHDVRLLWEAYDKSIASWARHDITTGMWFGEQHNGYLWCSGGGGHGIHVAVEEAWMAEQTALEAANLLDAQERQLSARDPKIEAKR